MNLSYLFYGHVTPCHWTLVSDIWRQTDGPLVTCDRFDVYYYAWPCSGTALYLHFRR